MDLREEIRDWIEGEADAPHVLWQCDRGHENCTALPSVPASVSEEHRLESGRRIDIALLDEKGGILLLVEIVSASAVTPAKARDLGSLPWLEVVAEDFDATLLVARRVYNVPWLGCLECSEELRRARLRDAQLAQAAALAKRPVLTASAAAPRDTLPPDRAEPLLPARELTRPVAPPSVGVPRVIVSPARPRLPPPTLLPVTRPVLTTTPASMFSGRPYVPTCPRTIGRKHLRFCTGCPYEVDYRPEDGIEDERGVRRFDRVDRTDKAWGWTGMTIICSHPSAS